MADAELSRRIHDWRKMRGMTQRELAAASGIKQATIAGYEICRTAPKSDEIIALARALHIQPRDLTGGPVPVVPGLRYNSPAYRMAAKDWRGKTTKEIAAELGCSDSMVRQLRCNLSKKGYDVQFRRLREKREEPQGLPIEALSFDSVDFGDRLWDARESACMTRRAAAERMSITVQSMESIERGRSLPTEGFIVRLAGLYGISPDELAGTPIFTEYPALRHGSPSWKLLCGRWDGVTVSEAAGMIGVGVHTLPHIVRRIRKTYGIEISFKSKERTVAKSKCSGCRYWTGNGQSVACCNYLIIEGQRRPRGADGECLGYRQKDKR